VKYEGAPWYGKDGPDAYRMFRDKQDGCIKVTINMA
jgi:hypothetical protein